MVVRYPQCQFAAFSLTTIKARSLGCLTPVFPVVRWGTMPNYVRLCGGLAIHLMRESGKCIEILAKLPHQSQFFTALSKEFAERLAMGRAGGAFTTFPAPHRFGITPHFSHHI